MRIVLFASPGILGPFILATLIQLKEQIVWLVIPTSEYSASPAELLSLAQQAKIPVLNPQNLKNSDFLLSIKEASPDLLIVATFDKKIPPEVISLARYEAINIHSSYLPDYRGACPEFWAIRNGEKETGVSIHYISDEFDSGDIIFQEKVPIGDDDTVGILLYRLAPVAARLLMKVREEFGRGNVLRRIPQNKKSMRHAPLVQTSDLQIKWNSSSQDIYNLIRAANPVGGAWTTFRGFQIKIWQATVVKEEITSDILPPDQKPGTLFIEGLKRKVFVRTGDGFMELKAVQLALYYILDAWSFTEKALAKDGEVLV